MTMDPWRDFHSSARSQQQVAVIKEWIDAGATWPDDPPAADPCQHWAFHPPVRPSVPTNSPFPIDAFIGLKHAQLGLTPAPEAERRTLIRRLSLDLLGLPPSPTEVESFVNDSSPRACEALVERLLASPHYGERWGRHWLDLARWAETEGYEGNTFRSSAWRYRDYVVKAFNDDKPYDRFLLEQLAGDELEPYADENLIATGFLSSARYSHNEEDKVKQRNDILVDIANASATVTLGLTMGCAQCHDHKFDPIGIRDYYRWQGLFARGQLVYALLKDGNQWREFETSVPAELVAARKLRDVYHTKAEANFSTDLLAKLTAETRLVRETPKDFLALSQRGELDLTQGGLTVSTNATETATRRSLYLRQTRGEFPKAQEMFDGPTGNESCPRRHISTVPLQPLYLLNNPFMVRRAETLAKRIESRADGDRDRAVVEAFTLCLARPPTVKGGQIIGATDELGYTVVEDPVHPNDLQATMLNALGVNQHDLYYLHQLPWRRLSPGSSR